MNVRIENGHLIAGNVAVPAAVVPAIEAFFREKFEVHAQTPTPPTDDEREALARIWAKHRAHARNGWSGCTCGETNPGLTVNLNTWHEVHLRHAILVQFEVRRQGPPAEAEEWEYGVAHHNPVGNQYARPIEYPSHEDAKERVAAVSVPAWVVRRRKAGQWETLYTGEEQTDA